MRRKRSSLCDETLFCDRVSRNSLSLRHIVVRSVQFSHFKSTAATPHTPVRTRTTAPYPRAALPLPPRGGARALPPPRLAPLPEAPALDEPPAPRRDRSRASGSAAAAASAASFSAFGRLRSFLWPPAAMFQCSSWCSCVLAARCSAGRRVCFSCAKRLTRRRLKPIRHEIIEI